MQQIQRNFEYSYDSVPTLYKFSCSEKFIKAVLGPFGSGKSSACCVEIVKLGVQQAPRNGKRITRWAAIRNTYQQLSDTTIKTFLGSEDGSIEGWFPPKIYGKYIKTTHDYTMKFMLPDKTMVIIEVLFRALDKPDHVRNLLSMELTGAWLNEYREIPKAVFEAIQGRVGRFPAVKDGGCTWAGVIMDSNPPDTDHWSYNYFEEIKPANSELFRQPSGRGPKAENLIHLPKDYYKNLCIGKSEAFCKVYADGEYGYVQEGKPVYPAYKDDMHLSKQLIKPIVGIPLRLGWDFGLTPSCVIAQLSPKGRLLVLRECVSVDMGIRRLARQIVKPLLMNEFKGFHVISTADMAGRQRVQTDERTCLEELAEAGIPTESALTNDMVARIGAVEGFLSRYTADGPALLLDPRCTMLRQGFLGKYKYRRVQVSGDERFVDKPEKNIWSNCHDALQYVSMEADKVILSMKRYQSTPFGTALPVGAKTDIVTAHGLGAYT
jgi:hypothetical protein